MIRIEVNPFLGFRCTHEKALILTFTYASITAYPIYLPTRAEITTEKGSPWSSPCPSIFPERFSLKVEAEHIMGALLTAWMVLGALYYLLILAFWVGLHRLKAGSSIEKPSITVVIAARNESETIDACLSALAAQDYPADRMEVVVVDDRSSDDTVARACRWVGRLPSLRVLSVAQAYHLCPKKNALEVGIRAGTGELILTTDADCRPPPGWIDATASAFEPDVGMVLGHAPLVPKSGVIQALLALQALVVSALGAGSAGVGFPLTCSGRNLGYRRSAFYQAGGFEEIGDVPGGDDVLLMRKIASKTAWKVRFNASPGVPSSPHADRLLRRQLRYQSKSLHYGVPALLMALPVYIFHVALAFGPFFVVRFPEFWAVLGSLVVGKVLTDGLLLWTAASRFKSRRSMVWFPVLEFISVPYIVFFSGLGALRTSRWESP